MRRPESPGRRRLVRALALCVVAGGGPAWATPETGPIDAAQFVLTRHSDGLYLSARLPLEISPVMEDVLRKGVPLHFLWQAELLRSRWYWTDKSVASVARTVRLVFQPLTRRWRLSYATGTPSATGLQYEVHQNFDSLADALAGAGRVSHWKLADASRWSPGGDQYVVFSFALDLSQLPRPFQLGLFNQSAWSLTLQRTLAVPERLAADPDAGVADNPADNEQ